MPEERGSYEIRVRGRIGPTLAERFDGFEAEVEPAETVLRGEVRDQAALHGLLARIEALGLELVEVRQVGRRGEPIANDL
jgi:hypothetical protein